MRRFFYWLADRLRPWRRNSLPEELQFPEIDVEEFRRGSMLRVATISIDWLKSFGIFDIVGQQYVRPAARAWRPRELFLMEDLSLAFYLVEQQRLRGILVEPVHIDRFVETIRNYFEYVGDKRTLAEVRAPVNRYLDERSAPDAELLSDAFRPIAVNHSLLDQLPEINEEIGRRFPGGRRPASLGDLGLRLNKELDDSRYEHCTPNNCRTFAQTGGEGVHFSLLIRDGAITEDSPVVMTAPAVMGGVSFIVGETLFDFLCLGATRGYFALEQLAFDQEETLEAYTKPDEIVPTVVENGGSFPCGS